MKHLAILSIVAICLAGCQQYIKSDCESVSESVYVNERFPARIEKYAPDSMRIVTFEYDFNDTVSIWVNYSFVAKKYLVTTSAGFAGKIRVEAQPNDVILIKTSRSCARFRLRNGYNYLYINKLKGKGWGVAYSNFSRGYF